MSVEFYALPVAEIRRESTDAVSLKFSIPPELKDTFAFQAGQHLTLRTQLNGEEVRRNYSVCVAPHEGELRIAIKRIEGGLFSTWVNEQLTRGSTLDIRPATGRFTWSFDVNADNFYVGIAAGSGITPVLSILKTALTQEPKSRFCLLYGNRNSSSIMFLEELSELKNRFLDRLEVYHFLSAEDDEIEIFNGRLDTKKYDEIFPALLNPNMAAAFFICGPGPMMDTAEQSLHKHGVDKQKILSERFTASRPSENDRAKATILAEKAAGLQFTAILDGRRRRIEFNSTTKNMLDSVRAAGLPAPFACKAGVCATCRAKLVSGQAEMLNNYGLTEAEVAQGYILTCQAIPLNDDVVVNYDS